MQQKELFCKRSMQLDIFDATLCACSIAFCLLYTQMCQIDYQYTTFTFGAGDLTTAVYNVSASDPKSNMWIVNVTYTGGNANRQVDVEFRYDAKATKPVYAFISESPMLHYVSIHYCTTAVL